MQTAHAELLRSFGYTVDDSDIALPPTVPTCKSPILPDRPHHYDPDGRPIFTSEQVAWADPEQFGFHDYYVVEEEETSHPFALNYADEVLLPKKRPVHKYIRKERFKFILGQLMGCSGNVPPEVLQVMDLERLRQLPPDQVWDAVRTTLKTHKWRIFYNRIPAILSGLGLLDFRFSDTGKFQDILHDFSKMDEIFESLKTQLNRSYFPNLRFTAIKLMKRHGIEPPYPIPLARTQRKLEGLEEMYNVIWQAIEQKKLEEFYQSLGLQ